MLRNYISALFVAATMSVAAESPFFLNPEPGEVPEISVIEITFGSADWEAGNRAKFTFTGPEGVELPSLRNRSFQAGWSIYFEDDAVITTPGEYVLTIPAGRFIINGEENAEESFVYTIVENYTPGEGGGDDPDDPTGPTGSVPDYVIDPAPGSYQTIAEGFTIIFDAQELAVSNAEGISLAGPDGDYVLNIDVPFRQPKLVMVPINGVDEPVELSVPGNYTLTIASLAITVDGVLNVDPLVFEYTIEGSEVSAWDGEIVADPADQSEVVSLKDINVKFVGASAVRVADNLSPSMFPKLYSAATDAEISGAMAFASADVLELSLYSEVTEPGSYYLKISKDFCTIDGARLEQDLVLSYTIPTPDVPTGIECILSTDSERTDVYALDGVKILTKGNIDEIKTLPAGVYIAKGKKFYVK